MRDGKYEVGDRVVVVPSPNRPYESERHYTVRTIYEVRHSPGRDTYYRLIEGGFYSESENALVLESIYNSPLYRALS
jgi:hypothetical protein